MSKENFDRQASDFLRAIDVCFDNKLFLPGLALIYAAIDAMAWLAKADEADPVGDSFQTWVKTYLLTSYNGNVETADQLALDLYGARCAVLHAQVAESDLSRRAKAREVHYRFADGTGLVPVEGLNAPLLHIYVNPNSLKNSFAAAVERFRGAIAVDGQLQARVCERAARYFCEVTFQ